MPTYRRRLPHISLPGTPTFLTWCLHNALPPNRYFPADAKLIDFPTYDRRLDMATTGPQFLSLPPIATLLTNSLHHAANVMNLYTLHAWVIMPNHVHILVTPQVPLSRLTHSLKSYTAHQAKSLLPPSPTPFWQSESYDHLIRSPHEFRAIQHYIEQNPVTAGLALTPESYPHSSATPK